MRRHYTRVLILSLFASTCPHPASGTAMLHTDKDASKKSLLLLPGPEDAVMEVLPARAGQHYLITKVSNGKCKHTLITPGKNTRKLRQKVRSIISGTTWLCALIQQRLLIHKQCRAPVALSPWTGSTQERFAACTQLCTPLRVATFSLP